MQPDRLEQRGEGAGGKGGEWGVGRSERGYKNERHVNMLERLTSLLMLQIPQQLNPAIGSA